MPGIVNVAVNEPETGPIPLRLVCWISVQPLGVPLLSVARHSSARRNPEPPSQAVKVSWTDCPTKIAPAVTFYALSLHDALPISLTVTRIGPNPPSVATLPAPSTKCAPSQ